MFFLFFPISGRRPKIPVLAGGQGRNPSMIDSGPMGKKSDGKTPRAPKFQAKT